MPDLPHLLPTDEDNLDRARDWVKGHFTEAADETYAPIDGKLRVVDAILSEGWIDAGENSSLLEPRSAMRSRKN
jgi:hypothetical protein